MAHSLTQVVAALFELRDGDVASTSRDLRDEVVAYGELRTREEPGHDAAGAVVPAAYPTRIHPLGRANNAVASHVL